MFLVNYYEKKKKKSIKLCLKRKCGQTLLCELFQLSFHGFEKINYKRIISLFITSN